MSTPRIRASVISVIALALFGALFARLWYLQVATTSEFEAAAARNSVQEIIDPAPRGRILDVKGRVLVDNRMANVLTVDRTITDRQQREVLRKLSVRLDRSPKQLKARLDDPRNSPYTPVRIADNLTYEQLQYVAEHRTEFPGVRAATVPVRQYVNGSTAFHVLGYLGEINEAELKAQVDPHAYQLGDKIGKSGVELTYESDLRGRPGVTRVEVDATGRVVRRLDKRPARAGHDVRLTVDLDVQQVTEAALKQGLDAARKVKDPASKDKFRLLNAPAGAAIVLDTTDGSVVSLASEPDFNANEFVNGIRQSTWEWLGDPRNNLPLVDRAVSGMYAPASTFKLVTAIAGLRAGVVDPTTTIVDNARYAYPTDPDHPFKGEGANGKVDLPRALAVSSDVYFYRIGGELFARQKRGDPTGTALQDTARELGFGAATGIALPTESVGRVPDAAWKQAIHDKNPAAFPYPEWLPGDNILSSIGQGDMLVTPVQMASAYMTLADGGTRYSPRLADAVFRAGVDAGNAKDLAAKKVRDLAPIKLGTVDIPQRDALMAGFTGVVENPKGTATAAFAGFPPGLAAGKTGTAQVQGKQNTSWFVGMTPAAQPRYIVLVVVEEGGYGAQTAAPISRAIMEQLNGLPVGAVTNVSPPAGN
ncbi:MAG: penicillin-binding protein 2 [Acidimicrobiia bacterium]|nr:penicillin-binding protein 2 [Acidimicrobiia bacterium]